MTAPAAPPSSRVRGAGTTRFGLPAGTRLTKAHGTGNCFLLVDDPTGRLDISAASVAALCDVATGIGADGLIRCVRVDGRWFMDYRNADGSPAEMCGNGIRVLVDHLRRGGLADLAEGEALEVATRGGIRTVRALGPRPAQALGDKGATDQWYSVDMGPAVSSGATDMSVSVVGLEGTFDGIRVALPNPHVVIDVRSRGALRRAVLPTTDLRSASSGVRPVYDPDPAEGINLELVVDVTEAGAEVGHLLMRVLERGVGETLSCGTGCCAAAVAGALRRGSGAPRSWIVDVPGGRVHVELPTEPGGSVTLSGPAVEVAQILL